MYTFSFSTEKQDQSQTKSDMLWWHWTKFQNTYVNNIFAHLLFFFGQALMGTLKEIALYIVAKMILFRFSR